MLQIINFLQSFRRDEEGQALTEYGLIIALVAVALLAVIGVLTGALGTAFDAIAASFPG